MTSIYLPVLDLLGRGWWEGPVVRPRRSQPPQAISAASLSSAGQTEAGGPGVPANLAPRPVYLCINALSILAALAAPSTDGCWELGEDCTARRHQPPH